MQEQRTLPAIDVGTTDLRLSEDGAQITCTNGGWRTALVTMTIPGDGKASALWRIDAGGVVGGGGGTSINCMLGIAAKKTALMLSYPGQYLTGWGYYTSNGHKYHANASVGCGPLIAVGETVLVIYDQGKFFISIEGEKPRLVAEGLEAHAAKELVFTVSLASYLGSAVTLLKAEVENGGNP